MLKIRSEHFFAVAAMVLIASLTSIVDLAIAAPGDLFAVGSAGTVFEISPSGAQSTFASGLGASGGLAFDSSGNLFVSDTQNKSIFGGL
jgi:hypothetical protein